MSVFDDPGVGPQATAAAQEQRAAIQSMRARQAAAKGPTVFLPFGRQQPLSKYVGMDMIPMQRNPWLSEPSVLLTNPEPGAHYGFVENTPRTRGLFRSHVYEPVYLEELKPDNDAEIEIETVTTEEGVRKLVLWHGLRLVKIPQKAWFERYERPAMMSAVALGRQQESFTDFSAMSVTAVHETVRNDQGHEVQQVRHEAGSGYTDLRGKAELSFKVTDVG